MEFPIGFARTTYKRAKQFQEMLEELSCQIPLAIARLYLVTGEKLPEYSDAIYEQIDELQALRKKGIQGEMKYVLAQVSCYMEEDAQVLPNFPSLKDWSVLTQERFLGQDVVSGDNILPGFSRQLYRIAPSLQVYELFMWFSQHELTQLQEQIKVN